MAKRKSSSNGFQEMSESEINNSLDMFYGLHLDEHQKKFRDCIWDESKLIIFCNACSGSGKTTVALGTANLLYQSGKYDKIIYVVSPTQEQKVGYLPGSTEEKSLPYMEPLFCALKTLGVNPMSSIISSDNILNSKNGNAFIYATSHTYLRGVTFSRAVVILDESQNFYCSDMKKTLSRIDDSCKTIVIGHTGQVDLYKNPKNSGFMSAMNLFKSKDDNRAAFCELKINYRGWVSSVADELESEIKI